MQVGHLLNTVEDIQFKKCNTDVESYKEIREECVIMFHKLLHLICISKPQVDLPEQEIELFVTEILKFLFHVGPISELPSFVLAASSPFGNNVNQQTSLCNCKIIIC